MVFVFFFAFLVFPVFKFSLFNLLLFGTLLNTFARLTFHPARLAMRVHCFGRDASCSHSSDASHPPLLASSFSHSFRHSRTRSAIPRFPIIIDTNPPPSTLDKKDPNALYSSLFFSQATTESLSYQVTTAPLYSLRSDSPSNCSVIFLSRS